MTIQMLVDVWKVSGAHHSMKPSATEADIRAAEAKIGVTLPPLLREVYPSFNGGWTWGLCFFPRPPSQNITR